MLKPKTRIQERNSRAILEAGLEVFAQQGYRGATLDEIAVVAGLSKPNLLYYFPSKDAVYAAILSRQLETWLDPLRMIDPAGDPVEEMLAYVRRKVPRACWQGLKGRLKRWSMKRPPSCRAGWTRVALRSCIPCI